MLDGIPFDYVQTMPKIGEWQPGAAQAKPKIDKPKVPKDNQKVGKTKKVGSGKLKTAAAEAQYAYWKVYLQHQGGTATAAEVAAAMAVWEAAKQAVLDWKLANG